MPVTKKSANLSGKEKHIQRGLMDLRVQLVKYRVQRWNPEAVTSIGVSSVVLEYLLDIHDTVPVTLESLCADFDQVAAALREAAKILKDRRKF